jgi:hypothetical protein
VEEFLKAGEGLDYFIEELKKLNALESEKK